MTTITRTINCEDIGEVELTFNECTTKREIVRLIQEWKNNINYCEKINQDPDMYIFVLYEDGSVYSRSYQYEENKFKYTHIKAVMMDDGYEYYTFGEYGINEHAVPYI